ncbi:MAG: fibrobacter succinogenes major paralogous domain-containing protein, partial [Bacteroidales bacterium]|nr:fibrobacter succinogenes major paralogous domain-containing protein [Bacteroidales bacterium]
MKKLTFSLLIALIATANIFAQSPQAVNYQAVVRDTNGAVISMQNISLRISILSSNIAGPIVFAETHNTTTNSLGLVNIAIGTGQVESGNFSTISWGSSSYFLKTEADVTGGTNYMLMGISQLLSVPYALHSSSLSLTDENGNVYEITIDTLGNIVTMIDTMWICGNSLTDTRDGQSYNTVLIGTQCWMAENLAYLPSVSPSSVGSNTTTYYYVYDYQGTDVSAAKATSNYNSYGVLYNWHAAMDGSSSSNSIPSGVQGICPSGWHLPGDAEYTLLSDFLGGLSVAGGKMKETGTTHWTSPNIGATNSSGFTTLPGGRRYDYDGSFFTLGNVSNFWSSTEYSTSMAWNHSMDYTSTDVYRVYNNKGNGFSVRCIQNATPCTPLTDQPDAGPDQTRVTADSVILAGNVPVNGTGLWTIISGNTGIITNNILATTTFFGQPGESYNLVW